MPLADFIVAGKEEEIVDVQILDGFLCSGNKRIRVRTSEGCLFRGYLLNFIYTETHYLVLSLEQLQREVDQRVLPILLSQVASVVSWNSKLEAYSEATLKRCMELLAVLDDPHRCSPSLR